MLIRSTKKKKIAPTLVSVLTRTYTGETWTNGGGNRMHTIRHQNTPLQGLALPAVMSNSQVGDKYPNNAFSFGRLSFQCYASEASAILAALASFSSEIDVQTRDGTRTYHVYTGAVQGVQRTVQFHVAHTGWNLLGISLIIT